jgi:RNA polymerase sigma-70 factor (ECF subfamily)
VEVKRRAQALHLALAILTKDERRAVEAAFLAEMTHAEVAARLNQPLGTIKTRIRSGLHKLRCELDRAGNEP